jgi:hypothetical protein
MSVKIYQAKSSGGDLSGYVPYTGATQDVDLGAFGLQADNIGIGTTPDAQALLHAFGGGSVARIILDANNNIARIFSFRTGNVQRFALRVDGNETGSNSGANFQIRRYDDAGAYIDSPIEINRATGIANIKDGTFVETTDGTIVSGTSSATITFSQLIPANSFSVGDIVRIRCRFRKTTLNGNTNFIVSVNSSNSLVGATNVALGTSNFRFNQIKRDLFIKSSTNTETYPTATSVASDYNFQATAVSTNNIDWTIPQYIIFSITQGSNDTSVGSGYSIQRVWG